MTQRKPLRPVEIRLLHRRSNRYYLHTAADAAAVAFDLAYKKGYEAGINEAVNLLTREVYSGETLENALLALTLELDLTGAATAEK